MQTSATMLPIHLIAVLEKKKIFEFKKKNPEGLNFKHILSIKNVNEFKVESTAEG